MLNALKYVETFSKRQLAHPSDYSCLDRLVACTIFQAKVKQNLAQMHNYVMMHLTNQKVGLLFFFLFPTMFPAASWINESNKPWKDPGLLKVKMLLGMTIKTHLTWWCWAEWPKTPFE